MSNLSTLDFHISINAPKEKVWSILWNDETYRQWTAPFAEGSYAESDWKEGSEILFLSPEGSGMYSRIKKLVPYTEMVFEHLGEIIKGERKESAWAGALERYFLREENGHTELTVKVDVEGSFSNYMTDKFPKALQVVKELAEKIPQEKDAAIT